MVLLLLICCLLLLPLCNWSMFCCTLLYVHSSFVIILMEKRELVALLCLSSWCIVIVVWFFLAMQWVCLQFVIVVFPDHTHLLFLVNIRPSAKWNSIAVSLLGRWLPVVNCSLRMTYSDRCSYDRWHFLFLPIPLNIFRRPYILNCHNKFNM